MPLLQIDIEARYAQFRDAMNRIERQTQTSAANMNKAFETVKNTIKGLGVTLTADAVVSFIRGAIDAADHLNDLSKQTGVAVDTLGGLGFAAGQAGGDLESIAAAAGKLNKSIAEAAGGNKEAGDAFKALGIDIYDAQGRLKTADQVLIDLANSFAGFADGPEKAAIAMRLLGKSGAETIAFLNDGGQAIQENIDFYKRYAGVTQEVANQADEFNDSIGKVNVLIGSFGRTLAAELLPSLNGIAGALLESKENGDLFNEWAGRAAGVIQGVGLAGVAAATVLDSIALKAKLAGDVMQHLATLKPGQISEDWARYSAAIDKSAEGFHNLYQGIRNPPPANKFDALVGKLDGQIKEEKDLAATRNQFLKKYRDDDLISERDYQKGKVAAQKEAVENTKKLMDQQIVVLQAQKKFAKTGQEAEAIQGKIDGLYKNKLLVGTEKPRAPVLPSGAKTPKSKTADLESKAADVGNRDLERMSERERELLADRSEFLNDYYRDDLISITDYFAGRRAAQQEALQAQTANIDQEISNLQQLKPKDKNQKIEVEGKIESLLDKRAALQRDAGRAAIQLSIDENRAAKAFQETLAGINAELLEQQGLLPQAAGLRFDQSNDRIKTRLQTERDAANAKGDTVTADARNADIEKLATLRKLAVARAELNSIDEVGAQVQFKLTEATDRAQIGAQTGALTEMQSLRAISDARLQAVADLQQVATALDEVAKSTGDPRMLEQARGLQLEVDKLAASADLVRERFEDAFSSPFESALEKMINGTASFRDVIKGLFSDIASEFTKIATKDFTKQMLGKDGVFGGAVDFVSNIFGGASKAPKASAEVANSLAKGAGGAVDTAAATAASAALTTLASSTAAADTALLTMGTTAPAVDGALATMGATTLATDGALVSLAASASIAAAALAAVGASGGGKIASNAVYAASDFLASKDGNVFDAGNVVPFAKGGIPGVVNAPTYFPMKDGRTGLMGEAGPEAIMPLARDPGGELAVRMVGDRGNVTLLPITRDSNGRMAVRSASKAFADGGVFGGMEPMRRAGIGGAVGRVTSNVVNMRAESVAVPVSGVAADQVSLMPRGGDTYNVYVTPPAGVTTASAQQWGATAARQMKRSAGRNG